MDALLTAMPTIHTVLIGFFGALVCGLAVYGVQKLQEAEDCLAQAKDEAVKVCSLEFFVEGANDEFAMNRTFDWVELIRLQTWMENWRLTQNVDDKFGAWCERFMCFSTHAFLAHPFLGVVSGYTPVDADRDSSKGSADEETLRDIRKRMRELKGFKTKLEGTAIAIVELNVQIKIDNLIMKDRQLREESLGSLRERLPELSDVIDARREERENILKDYEVRNQTDVDKVKHFFITIDRLAQAVLPSLELAFKIRERWESRFKLRALMWLCICFSAVFLLGIVFPLLIVAIKADFDICLTFGWCWSRWYGYVLFCMSFVPYFVGAIFMIRMVRTVALRKQG